MKLSTLTAKLTCIRSNTVRALAVAAVAGAALTAAAPAAGAQRLIVRAGHERIVTRYVAPAPVVVEPAYGYSYGYTYAAPAWRAPEVVVRHPEPLRFHHENAFGRR